MCASPPPTSLCVCVCHQGDNRHVCPPPPRVCSTRMTTYFCANFQLPSAHKHHIIMAEPLVASSLLHHMVLFACNPGTPADPATTGHAYGEVYECDTSSSDCLVFYVGWAPGVGPSMAVPEAALPFGE